MNQGSKLRSWLMRNRASARIALMLRLSATAVSMVMSLFWQRMFVQLLGREVYGLLLTFQQVIRLVGVGDFGITGALGVRTGQMLGRGEQNRLVSFLASARTLYLGMMLLLSLGILLLSPWLPKWLGFVEAPGSGTLNLLFVVGAGLVLITFVAGYFNSVNSGCGTVMWPIVPSMLITQLALMSQYFVAREGTPLWGIALTQGVFIMMQAAFAWFMLRSSFPDLARLRPLGRDTELWRDLTATSGWVCLSMLGSSIYSTTDAVLVNAGFGSGMVPPYSFNYKPIEIAVQIVISASAVSLAKLNMWLASPAPESRDRALVAMNRLRMFQTLLGCGGAMVYLALDNKFIELWQGSSFHMPMMLQWAFALNLAVTTSGDAGIQVAGVLGRPGLRAAGLAIALTGLLNLGLSLIAVQFKWIEGVAYATVVAQTILSLYLGWYSCRNLNLKLKTWIFQTWLVPVLAVATMAALQYRIGSLEWKGAFYLVGAAVVLILVQAPLTGVTREFLAYEWSLVQGIINRKNKS